MRIVRLPSEITPDYPPARGPVLLLTCMDMRLLDEIIHFTDRDNLANRYDHVVLAGAALGALGAPGCQRPKKGGTFSQWKKTFFDHLESAIDLHHIEDVYILEHRNCGAYEKVFKVGGPYDDTLEGQADEESCHRKYARDLEKLILRDYPKLRVHSFLMDLRGNVSVL